MGAVKNCGFQFIFCFLIRELEIWISKLFCYEAVIKQEAVSLALYSLALFLHAVLSQSLLVFSPFFFLFLSLFESIHLCSH